MMEYWGQQGRGSVVVGVDKVARGKQAGMMIIALCGQGDMEGRYRKGMEGKRERNEGKKGEKEAGTQGDAVTERRICGNVEEMWRRRKIEKGENKRKEGGLERRVRAV